MKRIIVAGLASILMCVTSLAHAQQQAAPAQQQPPSAAAAANNSPAQNPPPVQINPNNLSKAQRDYIVNTMLNQKSDMNSAIQSSQQQFKDAYAKMPQSQQLAVVTQLVSVIEKMPPTMRDSILNNMPPN